MKNTYAWGLIVLVLVIVAGAYWMIMSKNVDVMPADMASTTQQVKTTKPAGMGTKPTTVTTGTGATTGTTATDPRPKLASLSPMSGKVGTVVTIKGMNFDKDSNIITFGATMGLHHRDGTPDNQIESHGSADGKTLTFLVPASEASGELCDQNNVCKVYHTVGTKLEAHPITVINKNGLSNTLSFTVTD